jgi:hypothetical protein
MANRGNHKKRVRMRKAVQAAKKSKAVMAQIRRIHRVDKLTVAQLEIMVRVFG